MAKIKRWMMWWLMLTKRLYKKVTFVVILLLIPLMVLGYGAVAQEESGMVTIALACEDPRDPMAKQIMDELEGSSQLIRFLRFDDGDAAVEAIRSGKADGAWIFEEDLAAKIATFAGRPARRNAFVRVVERESTIQMLLSREKLTGAVFTVCSEQFYLQYIRKTVPELKDLTDAQLMEYYQKISLDGELFEHVNLDGTAVEKNDPAGHYLLTPIRGLLAVIVVLCGMATAMFTIQDNAAGTFGWVAQRKRGFVEFGCQMICVSNACAVMLLSLAAVGLALPLGRELLITVMYAICVSVFCMTLRRLCGGLRSLGMVMPLLVVVMMVMCPVFMDLTIFREAQLLFPPTYYINATHSNKALLAMVIYAAVLGVIYFLSGKILRRQ